MYYAKKKLRLPGKLKASRSTCLHDSEPSLQHLPNGSILLCVVYFVNLTLCSGMTGFSVTLSIPKARPMHYATTRSLVDLPSF